MSFFASGKKREVSIIYDVSADSVGAAIILIREGMMPHIVYVCREYFFPNGAIERSARHMIVKMRDTIHRVDEHIRRSVLRHGFFDHYPRKEIYFVFSSPWAEAKPKNLDAKKFLSKLSSDFRVPKEMFVVTEDNVALPKEIHDIALSLYRTHKTLSFDHVVSEVVGPSHPSAKEVAKRLLGKKVSTSNSISADLAFLITAAYVGGGLSRK